MTTVFELVVTPACVRLNGGVPNASEDIDEANQKELLHYASEDDSDKVIRFFETVDKIITLTKDFRLKPIFDFLSETLTEKGLTDEQVGDVIVRLEAFASKRRLKLSEEPIHLPQTWEEGKTEVPGLTKWQDAKSANPDLTIVSHLRDSERGYGRWSTVEPGMPRRHLITAFRDEEAYNALNVFLRRHPMPKDLYLPTKKQVIDRLAEGQDPTTWSARVEGAMRARANRTRQSVEKI